MTFTYLATSQLFNKRTLVKPEELISTKKLDGEYYSSLFKYPTEDITDHIASNKSIKGYTGGVYGDWFVIDLDGKNLEELATALYPLLDDLDFYEAKYYLFFSGGKGFHLYIHKAWIKYDEEDESRWNEVSKQIAIKIKEDYPDLEEFVDLSNYDNVRIFRFPFSIHKSGKKKVRLDYVGNKGTMKESLILSQSNEYEIIKEIFNPSMAKANEPIFIQEKLEDKKVIQNKDSTVEEDHIAYPYGSKTCMHRLLNEKELIGSRHAVALRLMSWWSHTHGYDKDYTSVMLHKWNERLDDPLLPEEIDNVIKYYPGYTYTCQDDIKKKYCSDHCVEFQTRNFEDEYVLVGNDYIDTHIKAMQEDKKDWIYPSSIWPELTVSPWKPSHGHIIIVVGGSSSGKTTLVNNLIWQLKTVPCLYFSYDMAGLSFAETFITMTKTDPYSSEQVKAFYERMKTVVTITDPTIRAEDLHRYYKTIIKRTGIKPKLIVIDYIQYMPAKGSGAMERAISITRELKTLAKKEKVVIVALSQVPKEVAGDANIPLGMNAAKDSGEITNIADQVWTIWRPDKGRSTTKSQAATHDKTLTVNVAKDKYGIADWQVGLYWAGDYTVRSNIGGYSET